MYNSMCVKYFKNTVMEYISLLHKFSLKLNAQIKLELEIKLSVFLAINKF